MNVAEHVPGGRATYGKFPGPTASHPGDKRNTHTLKGELVALDATAPPIGGIKGPNGGSAPAYVVDTWHTNTVENPIERRKPRVRVLS